MKIESSNDRLMVMAAVRYCLGRQSYIVSSCIEFLNGAWDKELSDKDHLVIMRDIVEFLQDDPRKSFDYEYWNLFFKQRFPKMNLNDQEFIKQQVAHREKPFPYYES